MIAKLVSKRNDGGEKVILIFGHDSVDGTFFLLIFIVYS